MATSMKPKTSGRMTLEAECAADIMKPNPVSIGEHATIQEAAALLTDKGFSAAPVIDAAGRPIGVVSRSDIIIHDREKVEYVAPVPEFYDEAELSARVAPAARSGFQVVNVDRTRVGDIMTPIVFSVTPETPVRKVVREMLDLKVHRVFVVDRGGVLVGVVSASDVLQRLE
jgi:CBS domain-containing protein